MALKPVEIKITGNTARLAADMGKAQAIVGGAFKSMASSMTSLVSVGSIVALAKSSLELGNALSKASEKLGIGAEKLSAMKYAAELSDVSFEALQKGMKKFSQAIVEANAAGSDAATAFSVMGIATKDAHGKTKPLDTLFAEVANKFSRMEDGAGKVSIAVALLGRAGMDMIPVLNKGAAGLAELEGEAKRLGATISDNTAKKLEEMNDRMKMAGMIAKGTAANIMVDLVSALKAANDAYNAGGGNMFSRKWNQTQKGKISDILVPNPEPGGKIAAPNLDAIKKAAEERKKLLEEYAKIHSANMAREGEEVHKALAAEMGMDQEYHDTVSKLGMEEFAEWKRTQEEELNLLAKFDEEKIRMLKDLQDAQRAEFEDTEPPMAAYTVEEAFHTAEAYGNVALAVEQINAGFGAQNLLLEEGRAKIANYLESWGGMSKFAAKQFGSMSDSMLKFYQASGTKHREFFRLYQAMAVGEALISTYAGITRAFKDYMWPYSMIVAGIVGTAGFAQVANIASMSPGGAAHGGIDFVPAEQTFLLDRGERVVSPRQNEDLTEFLGGSGQDLTVILNVDGEALYKVMRKGVRSGQLNLQLA